MKVIITQNCVAGKVNDVVDVADGYAKNFLIKQGLALPVNAKTQAALSAKIARSAADDALAQELALVQKGHLEKMQLVFSLNASHERVHGSVSKKELLQEVAKHGIKLDAHALPATHLDALGLFKVPVKLHRTVTAMLSVEVKAS